MVKLARIKELLQDVEGLNEGIDERKQTVQALDYKIWRKM
jgi:hypothetical protein